uniref:Uncharacterized protein n=1 Tax=viral metagenome TaxID=1070528 RepID=A0A6H2A4A9_9ZZZZ
MSNNDKLKVIKRGYSKEAIEILEELLEQAKKGEIHELVTMANYGEHHYETRYTNSNDLVTLVGHIEKIKWRMLERMSQNITVL